MNINASFAVAFALKGASLCTPASAQCALSEIWSDKATFSEYDKKTQMEMAKLSASAKTGNLDATEGAVFAVGGSYKNWQNAFRKD